MEEGKVFFIFLLSGLKTNLAFFARLLNLTWKARWRVSNFKVFFFPLYLMSGTAAASRLFCSPVIDQVNWLTKVIKDCLKS